MGDLAASGDELQTLLQITSALTAVSEEPRCLDEVAMRIAKLVPVERCVLMHQCGMERDSPTLIYDFANARAAGGRTDPRHAKSLNISSYLEHFERVESFHSAFFWRLSSKGPGDVDPQIVDFIERTRPSRGATGFVNSVEGPFGSIATLIQLQYAGEEFSAKHLFFVNIIIFYLHVYLAHCSTRLLTSGPRNGLTCKEKEVLRYVVGGKTSWEVGRILSMSERTVKFHLRNIYTKLNVANRTQAVTIASRLRLI